jgi:ABC-type branched-subunit amino acid transport system ATPase component
VERNGTMALLETRELTVRFGGVTAVSNVSLTIEEGILTGIIGPNCAGKTTFIDAISGLVGSTGEILFQGQSVASWRPHRRAKAGLARTFQGLELFDEFTIQENLLLPAESKRRWSVLRDLAWPTPYAVAVEASATALERVGATHLSAAYPSELSYGERKVVSIARGLASGADLLLLDEPAAGLNSEDSLALGRTLRHLVSTGTTIGLIDHDMGLVMSVCDVIHVLVFGALIASGTTDEIRRDPKVIEAYLGDGGEQMLAETAA